MTASIQVICHGCGKPIAPGAGYLECDRGEAMARHLRLAKAERTDDGGWTPVDLSAILAEGPAVPWVGWHRDCDPDPESDSYWFAVERIATWPDVLRWTAHLMGKRWLDDSNWDDLLRGLANDTDRGPLLLSKTAKWN